ncbi:MAG: sensor histidine kinase [Chitinophagaceae bacterium]|nr:sensor histidine kinase [Chitinophagaceae bacterium]
MLTDILNDFLDLGRIEEGKIQVRPTHFDIRELTSNTINEYSDNLKKGQEIHYRHEGEKSVFLDASLLKHIILNLISNASKFSGEDSSIFVQTNVVKHQLALSIRDEGIGISFEDQQHLMERFFRGSNAANIQGTGLGLNIVSKYAELMNGRVDCISELDIGTTFTITFNP